MKVAVIGNCQGGVLAHVIEKAFSDHEEFVVRYVPSYEAAAPDDREFVRQADKVLSQVTEGASKNKLVEEIKTISREVIYYPLLSCIFLYPFSTKPHPRSDVSRGAHIPGGYYAEGLSDSQLIALMEKHPDRTSEDIADEFLALDYNDIIDLDALLERSRAQAERAAAISGLNIWPRVERLFRYQPVFWTNLHPAEVLLRPFCKFALERLDAGLSAAEIDAATENIERLGFAHMPIHPSIVRHFDIEWASPHYRYKGFQEGTFTAREYVCRFVRFDHDDGLAQAIHALHHGGDLQTALSGLLAARDRHPDGLEIPINLAFAYLRSGDYRSALENAVSALERYPEQKEWATLVCYVARLTLDSTKSSVENAKAAAVASSEIGESPAGTSDFGWRRLIRQHWRRLGRFDRRRERSTFSQAAE
jgi:hypothetical protein